MDTKALIGVTHSNAETAATSPTSVSVTHVFDLFHKVNELNSAVLLHMRRSNFDEAAVYIAQAYRLLDIASHSISMSSVSSARHGNCSVATDSTVMQVRHIDGAGSAKLDLSAAAEPASSQFSHSEIYALTKMFREAKITTLNNEGCLAQRRQDARKAIALFESAAVLEIQQKTEQYKQSGRRHANDAEKKRKEIDASSHPMSPPMASLDTLLNLSTTHIAAGDYCKASNLCIAGLYHYHGRGRLYHPDDEDVYDTHRQHRYFFDEDEQQTERQKHTNRQTGCHATGAITSSKNL